MFWCEQCSLGFPDIESRNRHIVQSGRHSFCKICVVRQPNQAGKWVEYFENNEALQNHCHSQHFGCQYCTNCRSNHYGCDICADDGIFKTFKSNDELVHHLRDFHLRTLYFGLFEDDPKYQCHECRQDTVFDDSEKLASHQRMHHGWVQCPYSSQDACATLPQIRWSAEQRAHMEGCHHPNPCNDFDTREARNRSHCPICDHKFSGQMYLFQHFHIFHPCFQCESYISTYFKTKIAHLNKCHGHKVPGFNPPREDRRSPPRATPPEADRTSSPTPKIPEGGPGDIYAVLGISPRCSHEEAKRAAREQRIATHPDKFKRQGISDVEGEKINERSKLVGFAADIVLDPVKRREHDQSMLEWKIKHARR